jgi:hypothetical protein
MFVRVLALFALLAAATAASSGSLRGEHGDVTAEQKARGARLVKNLVAASINKRDKQVEALQKASKAAVDKHKAAENHRQLQSADVSPFSVTTGWALTRVRPNSDCSGPTQLVVGMKLGECEDMEYGDFWFSHRFVCDRLKMGLAGNFDGEPDEISAIQEVYMGRDTDRQIDR